MLSQTRDDCPEPPVIFNRWRRWGAAAVLVTAGFAVYVGGLGGPFVYDDLWAVVENQSIRDLGSWEIFRPPDETPMAGRPMANASLAVSYALSGLEARDFRFFNLILHLGSALLLAAVVRRTLRSPRLVARFGAAAEGLALASALLWVVHPLPSEVVEFVTQRSEALGSLFYLLTVYAAIRAWDGGHRWRWSLAAVVAAALGMASKEMVVTAPVMVALWDSSFRGEPWREIVRRQWRLYLGLAACWSVTVGLLLSGPRSESVGFALSIGPLDYLLNQCLLIPHYLWLIVYPHPLVLDYGFAAPVPLAEALPGGLFLIALTLLAAFGVVRRRAWAFVPAGFFVLLSPSSSFLPIATEVGAERRVYLASAAVIALCVVGASAWLSRLGSIRPATTGPGGSQAQAGAGAEVRNELPGRRRVLVAVMVSVLAIVLAGVTVRRTRDYQSELALWQSVVAGRPQNYRGHNNLGLALAAEGDAAAAEEAFVTAIGLREDYPDAQSNLCNVLRSRGALDQAVLHCRRALEIEPDLAEAHNNLGAALAEQGRVDEAIGHFRRALEVDPAYAAARRNLSRAQALRPPPGP